LCSGYRRYEAPQFGRRSALRKHTHVMQQIRNRFGREMQAPQIKTVVDRATAGASEEFNQVRVGYMRTGDLAIGPSSGIFAFERNRLALHAAEMPAGRGVLAIAEVAGGFVRELRRAGHLAERRRLRLLDNLVLVDPVAAVQIGDVRLSVGKSGVAAGNGAGLFFDDSE
jgi:hypothetical protein